MKYIPPPSPLPRLLVEDAGWPHLRVTVSAAWTFFLEAGLVDDGCPFYSFLSSYSRTHAPYSLRFNPTSPFGKSILKCPFYYVIYIISCFIATSVRLRKPYFLQRRIRRRLLSPNYRKKHHAIPLHNLIRHRLKPPTPHKPSHISPTLPTPSHRHKTTFQLLLILPTTPLTLRPPTIPTRGLSLPRRHPREGVG